MDEDGIKKGRQEGGSKKDWSSLRVKLHLRWTQTSPRCRGAQDWRRFAQTDVGSCLPLAVPLPPDTVQLGWVAPPNLDEFKFSSASRHSV